MRRRAAVRQHAHLADEAHALARDGANQMAIL
jgi:hypothetical protein